MAPLKALKVTVDASNEIDGRALGSRDVLDRGEDLTLSVGIADRGIGRGLLPGDIADHAEALGDQLDDSLVEIAETIAQGEQLAVGLRHAGSVRTIATGGCFGTHDRVLRRSRVGTFGWRGMLGVNIAT